MAAILEERPDLAEAIAARPRAGESDLVRRLRAEIDTLVQQEDDRAQLRKVIADREAAYDRLALLNRELNHRVKNLFSVISGLIRQSAKGQGDSEDWAERIQARVTALGAAHSVTSDDEQMRPVPLDELVHAVLEPYRNEERLLVRGGPSMLVTRGQLTPLGMVLHELATNAAKYGGLSPGAGEDGQVAIAWRSLGEDLIVEWQEQARTIGAKEKDGPGFGSRLIEGSVRQLGGTIRRDMREGALDVSIRIPGLKGEPAQAGGDGGA
nr:sensor histidine kinase [Sphingomicrobium lutaoense]